MVDILKMRLQFFSENILDNDFNENKFENLKI